MSFDLRRRHAVDFTMRALCAVGAFAGAGVLLLLLIHVIVNGISALTPALLTELPAPLGLPGGGIAHAIVGSIAIVGMACLAGIPLGVAAGVFLAEHPQPYMTAPIRFAAD